MILLNALLSSAEEFVKIGSEAWKNNIFASLEIMWKGVLAIFVVIAIVIVVVILLNKLVAFYTSKPKNGEDDE